MKHAAGLLHRSDPTDATARMVDKASHPKPLAHPRMFTFPEQGSEIYTHSVPAYAERMIANVHPPDVVLELDGMQMAGAGELSRSNIVTAQRVHISAC